MDPQFVAASESVARLLAAEGLEMVYGGGSTGIMGAICSAALMAGGQVVGVRPSFWEKKAAAQGLTRLELPDSIGKRIERMFELGDAIIMLPGGWGTLEEFLQACTLVF